MASFHWVLLDSAGGELRTSDSFASQDEAEAWVTQAWPSLLDEGAEEVSLYEDGTLSYRMGLRPEEPNE